MAKERNSCVLRDLRQRPGNDICADCGAAEPDWVSVTLGVFVCQGCSLIHRSILSLNQVKSVLQDTFDDKETEFITSMGNDAAKAKYEQQVPAFYCRPSHTDCRGKYERQEFIHIEKQEPYSAGYREGFLWKRGRDNGQFLSRKFILSEREGALKYFNKQDGKEPKATMRIETLNATFQPAKIGNPFGLQITYLRDNSTRNIFVYHEDSKLVPRLTRNFMKEGYMEKTGPRDAYARGEVFIGSKENSYTVVPGLPPSIQGYHWKYGITIETPERKFLFACETEPEQKDWIAALQRVVNRPMMPQEYAGRFYVRTQFLTISLTVHNCGSSFQQEIIKLGWSRTSAGHPIYSISAVQEGEDSENHRTNRQS
ncbi:Arf-GAP with dual PH domain-containing protein 1 [Triplophysa tibetana]|uniref:Arf-GAP with dual PH domain-containing protein 1 n=1 Tax=Triplophysa tibetana TaxID=1572043 RepID=A0A5A9PV32_9TELE|nr:Arf-GAP with dual PH domain-containing protein 1 [Triplophysa tibetana]